MPVEFLWTIIGTQLATWVTLILFVNNRLDAQSRELRREFRDQLEAQGRVIGSRLDALTARFDAHLEHHAT